MRSLLAAAFTLAITTSCGSVADQEDIDAPDAGLDEADAAEFVCAPAPAVLFEGDPQGGISAQRTLAVRVTPVGGDQEITALEIAGIGIFGGTYTLGARIYDTDTEQLIASSNDVTQDGPFPNFTTTFDISATLSAGKTYALSVVTSGGGVAATAVVFTDEPLPFDAATGAFRIEGASVSTVGDDFPRNNLNGLPQITAHSCPAATGM